MCDHDAFTKQVRVQNVSRAYSGFFRIDWIDFEHTLYRGGWSQAVRRELFARGQAVVVLLYDPIQQIVLLVEQCRAGALGHALSCGKSDQAWLLEPVAGMIDAGESPEQAGKREALEEAGAHLVELEYICQFYPSPGGSDEILHLYASEVDASQLPEYAGVDEDQEDIRLVRLSFEQARAKLLRGEFNVASTLIALQWLLFQKCPL
jgi:ADP-ribose pyrophosphatase